jgi:predicted nucleic acid-binding protein
MIVCLDANIIIYLIEANPLWTPRATARVAALRAAGDEIAVCDAARLECLVHPFATGNVADQASYSNFFNHPSVRMLAVLASVWERAARIRASYRLLPLDSIHLAAAIEHGCGLFLTNDAQLSRCTDIAVEVLT